MHDSLIEKIAALNRKESGIISPAELAIKVRSSTRALVLNIYSASFHTIKLSHACIVDILIQIPDTFLTPLRKKLQLSDEASTRDAHSSCISLISQALETLANSGGVFVMTPRQSSDSSTSLINHVEVLCHALPLLQESIRLLAFKNKESEQSLAILRQQNAELSRKLESSQHQQIMEMNMQSFSELKKQNDLMATTILSSQMQFQQLEDVNRKNVSFGARI